MRATRGEISHPMCLLKNYWANREQTGGNSYQAGGVGGGMEWEVGVSRCKLLYIE